MPFIRKRDILERYAHSTAHNLYESFERRRSARMLSEVGHSFEVGDSFDIFLSHSYEDSRVVYQVYLMLQDEGFTVYVDWIVDPEMDRSKVTPSTARRLRRRLRACRSLIYLTSSAARHSVWMPWELGYMDGRNGRVSIAPILEPHEQGFPGREYLGLYPLIKLSRERLVVEEGQTQQTVRGWIGRR